MVSCLSLEHEDRLDVFEFEQLPAGNYCAVSYVWRGVPNPDYTDVGTFTVQGAEDGDPISIDVLRDVVWVAGEEVKEYLWLDRIGIVQSDKNDKAWQIVQMFRIYKESTCVVLPGGVGRLAFSDDETTWMDRAWTLQEALAPKGDDVVVLFSQNHSLEFEMHVSSLSFIDLREKPLCLGRTPKPAAYITLDDVLTVVKYSPHRPFGFNQPQAQPLVRALQSSEAGRLQAVWQSALMRTSSRPVDMIFSIMHFFDVSLNPREYEDDDRLRATVKFAQAILAAAKQGSLDVSEHWLCALYFMDASHQISTFLKFPETSVNGKAFIRMPNMSRQAVEDIMQKYTRYTRAHVYPHFLAEMQDVGEMDDSGYYSFTARFIMPLTYVASHSPAVKYPRDSDPDDAGWDASIPALAADGTEWCPSLTASAPLRSTTHLPDMDGWGVYLGDHMSLDVFLLLKKHEEGRFHRVSYFCLERGRYLWNKDHNLQAWFPYVYHKVKISIGSPMNVPQHPQKDT